MRTLSSLSQFLQVISTVLDDKVEEFTKSPIEVNAIGNPVINMNKVFNPKLLREKPTYYLFVFQRQNPYMMPLMSVFYSQVLMFV